jgi:hypothetical protein
VPAGPEVSIEVSCSWHEQLPVQSLHLIHHDLLSRLSKGVKRLNRYPSSDWVKEFAIKGKVGQQMGLLP